VRDESDHPRGCHLLSDAELDALRRPGSATSTSYRHVRQRCKRFLTGIAAYALLLQGQELEDTVSDAFAEADVEARIQDLDSDAAAVSGRLKIALNRVRARKVRDIKKRMEVPLVELAGTEPTAEDRQIARAKFAEIVKPLKSYLKAAFAQLSERDRTLLSENYHIPASGLSPRADPKPMSENLRKVALFRARRRFLRHLADVLPDPEDVSLDLRWAYDYLRSKEFAQVLFKRRRHPGRVA
jgi:hypothetical protein